MASSSTGRIPQGEVIIDFSDGGSYVKQRLENTVLDIERRRIQKEEGLKAQKALETLELSKDSGVEVKSADVDYLVSQVGCKKPAAESALKAAKGNLVQAVMALVEPRPRAKSVDAGGELSK